ncbi:hypothetical protein BTUL_0070g00270 [Botrytis tulipae]|uniref:Uncharacterized protein n=1 Tax=Botrytis tulipae TaxID=87230 RepID=A0A4Z1ER45_9HELO|nr:hypothetical protein BTUL_0070g00270 [Botrytis tulipae]
MYFGVDEHLNPDIKAGRGDEMVGKMSTMLRHRLCIVCNEVDVERLTETKYQVSVVWDQGQDIESKGTSSLCQDVSVQSSKAPKDSTQVKTIDYTAGNCVFFVMSLFVWFVDIELSADGDRNFGITHLPIRAESTLGEPLPRLPGSLWAG